MKMPFYETLRSILILIKNSRRNPFVGFFSTLIFGIPYLVLSGGRRTCHLRTRNGCTLYIRTQSSDLEVLLQHIAYLELYQNQITTLEPKCILDAGANIGISVFVFSQIFPDAKIIAIEPDPENFQLMERAVETFNSKRNITLVLGALYNRDQNDLGLNKNRGEEYSISVSRKKKGDIRAFRFETLIEEFGFSPDLIKLDIEGSEIDLLEDEDGFLEMIDNRDLLIELHGSKAYLKFFHLMESHDLKSLERIGEYWLFRADKINKSTN
jgi:FkbM family methyltransferase